MVMCRDIGIFRVFLLVNLEVMLWRFRIHYRCNVFAIDLLITEEVADAKIVPDGWDRSYECILFRTCILSSLQ